MTQNIQKFHPLRYFVIVIFSAAIIVACNSNNKTNEEPKPAEAQPAEIKKDSLPPIDKTDTVTTTAPETIKN